MAKIIELKSGIDLESLQLTNDIANKDDFSTVIVNASLDGIVTYDLNSVYTLWSPSMERLTGLKSEEVLGRNAFDLFPFLKEVGIDRLYEKSLKGEASCSSMFRYNVPETGLSGFTQQQNFPLFDEHGKVTGGMSIIRDVTGIKKRFDDLNQENFELKNRVRELEALLKLAKK